MKLLHHIQQIPIISNRWNGGSAVDFPGARRVDPRNLTALALAVQAVADNYEQELQQLHNAQFLFYIASLWLNIYRTSDLVFGSQHLHFVLVAETLQEEYLLTLQVLSLLYFYPLCSVTVLVSDVLWFYRHHYYFVEWLHAAGYIRHDPLDPREYQYYQQQQQLAFVKIKSVLHLKRKLHHFSSIGSDGDARNGTLQQLDLATRWNSVLVLLPSNCMIATPERLFDADLVGAVTAVGWCEMDINRRNNHSNKRGCSSDNICSSSSDTMQASSARAVDSVFMVLQDCTVNSNGNESVQNTVRFLSRLFEERQFAASADDDVGTRAAEMNDLSRWTASFVSVCALYNHHSFGHSNGTTNNSKAHVSLITTTLQWKTLTHTLAELGFSC